MIGDLKISFDFKNSKEYLEGNYLILSKEELEYYSDWFFEEFNWDLSTTQLKFENIFENKYYQKFLEVTPILDNNYDRFEELSKTEQNFSAFKDIASEFTTISLSYNIKDLCDNKNLHNYYTAKNPIDLTYLCARELLKNKKSFRLIRCGICDHYFIPKNSHKTLYCNELYKDNKTCKQYANSVLSTKKYEEDELCKKYRKRYKNLHKQTNLSNNLNVSLLYVQYKSEGPKMLEKYQKGQITANEFENWINSMKIKK